MPSTSLRFGTLNSQPQVGTDAGVPEAGRDGYARSDSPAIVRIIEDDRLNRGDPADEFAVSRTAFDRASGSWTRRIKIEMTSFRDSPVAFARGNALRLGIPT